MMPCLKTKVRFGLITTKHLNGAFRQQSTPYETPNAPDEPIPTAAESV